MRTPSRSSRKGTSLRLSLEQRLLERRLSPFVTAGLPASWDELLACEVCPLLGYSLESCEVSPRPPCAPKDAPFRIREHLRFLTPLAATEHTYVIRARSAWRFVPKERVRHTGVASSARGSLLLQHLGIPTPPLIWVREWQSHLGFRTHFLSVEKYLRGEAINVSDLAHTSALIRCLSRIHSNRSHHYGLPGKPNSSSPGFPKRQLRYLFLRRISRARKEPDIKLNNREVAELWRLLQEHASVAHRSTKHLRLIHGDVNLGNFRLLNQHEATVLDFDSLRYDHFSPEVIRAILQLSQQDAAHAKTTWQQYFQNSEAEVWHEFKQSAGLAFMLNLLANPRLIQHPQKVQTTIHILTDLLGKEPDDTQWTQIIRTLDPEIPPPRPS